MLPQLPLLPLQVLRAVHMLPVHLLQAMPVLPM